MTDFLQGNLGRLGRPVFRLGLSASYRPGKSAIYKALDEGVNYFFFYGFDTQMVRVLREAVKGNREKYVISTGAYNYIWGHQNPRRTLEKRLRQLQTDYLDVFLFLGVTKRKHFTDRVRGELEELRHDPRVRGVGMSCHDRAFAGEMAAGGALDVLMMRYNAAHRGAERDIFPHLAAHDPGVVSYTATRWTKLRRRPRGWPKDRAVPPTGMAYRFVLSNPHVDVCLTAPANAKQLEENLAAVRQGPLDDEEMRLMHEFGDAVYQANKWFW